MKNSLPEDSGAGRAPQGARIALALSGGVDSFAAALLLMEAGFSVAPYHLLLRPDLASEEAAREAAGLLGLALRVVDLTEAFDRLVMKPFARGYAAGRTPSPCVACNPLIKFGLLFELALKEGASFIATGHYTRLCGERETPALCRTPGAKKDQTYFLCRLDRATLSRTIFPLAGRDKADARMLAEAHGLPAREESQEICFLGGGDYRMFLQEQLGPGPFTPGDFVDEKGRVMGTHQGIASYTVGQRRGLGVPGPEPYYVLAIDPKKNRVVIGPKRKTFASSLRADGMVWTEGAPPTKPFDGRVQVRSRHRPAPARITPLSEGRIEAVFETPQSSMAPGQAAAVYQGLRLLGGGWIKRTWPTDS